MIGDVINFGNERYEKGKYEQAISQTGRARRTLWNYASVAARIPPEQRQIALSFEHHREIVKLGAGAQIGEVLKEEGEKAKRGLPITRKELRVKIQKLTPRKVKKTELLTIRLRKSLALW
jgi:hypothetical protein